MTYILKEANKQGRVPKKCPKWGNVHIQGKEG